MSNDLEIPIGASDRMLSLDEVVQVENNLAAFFALNFLWWHFMHPEHLRDAERNYRSYLIARKWATKYHKIAEAQKGWSMADA